MNVIDIIVVAVVAVIAFFIIRDVVKNRKAVITSCGCGSGCSGCSGCSAHPHTEEDK